jgi:TorA maturation chaperone TorD
LEYRKLEMAITATDIVFEPVISLARQALYRFASLSLLDPKCGSWEQLCLLKDDRLLFEAAAFIRELPGAAPCNLSRGDRRLADLDPGPVLARLPQSREELNRHFEDTFGLLVSNACPPHETEYINGKLSFQRSNALADVSGFYAAFGVTTSRQYPERPDHIVQELEFMAVLIGLTRHAEQAEFSLLAQRVSVCRRAQERFLREHLGWWAPAFALLLSREAAGGYYAATADFLAALMTAERTLFDLPPVTPAAAPTNIEPPDACNGCHNSH